MPGPATAAPVHGCTLDLATVAESYAAAACRRWKAGDFRVSVTAPSNNNQIKLYLSDTEPDYVNAKSFATIEVNDPNMLVSRGTCCRRCSPT